jgi:formamidopyrimidine-DNA glycosylase
MPELPEVETFARSLRPHVLDRVVTGVWGSGLALRKPVDLAALRTQEGRRIVSLMRTGKNLLFGFDSGMVLCAHLGMSGCYLMQPAGSPPPEHTHLRFSFAGYPLEMRYVDPRRFGLAVLCEAAQVPQLLQLGPDPLSPEFTADHLFTALTGSRRDLKALLLDQGVVAGLGNIYAAEALFHAGLRPTRRGHRVSRPAAARLHAAIRQVLDAAVVRRGTTLSDGGYVDAEGQSGENQHHLMVYGRQGQPCRVCGAPIQRRVQAQRSSYYCPECQK